MFNNNNWMNQYQNFQQAQNMYQFLENQQNMQNQFINPQVQGGAGNNFNQNNINNQNRKINLCFATIQGSRIMMKINPDDTVDEVLKKYLLRVNLDHLINKVDGKITFILSAQSLKFGDQRKIKDVAMVGNMNQILVNDTANLIGAF